jgi:uncharacterized protein YbjT (DUF2867 family)
MNSMARHVIFGTGAIGLATLDALLRRGETVRMVNRSGTTRVPDDSVGGNAADPQFTIDVARGAQVIYQTLNPPYERWVAEFPALQAGVLAAAEAHGPRLVSSYRQTSDFDSARPRNTSSRQPTPEGAP